MSSRNTIIIAVVIIAVFLGGLYLASTVPLFESEPSIIYQKSGRDIDSGYFIRVQRDLEEGTVEFSFDANNHISAFIMTAEQYYGFAQEQLATAADQQPGC